MSRLHIKLPEDFDSSNEVMVEYSNDMQTLIWNRLVEMFGINILKCSPQNVYSNGYDCVRRIFECDIQTIKNVSKMFAVRANSSIINSIEINNN